MDMPLAQLAPPLAVSAELVLAAGLAVVLLLAAAGVGVWRMIGKGPRRRRTYQRARTLLTAGDWQGAKRAIQELRETGIATADWAGRVNNLEGECLRAAGESALAAGNYEQALQLFDESAKLLHLDRDEAAAKVIDSMLGELRAFVAQLDDEKAIRQARRILQLQAGQPEAAFWLGLVSIRQGHSADAESALRQAYESAKGKSVEPALYLGMLLVREGRAKDGLKLLADANKLAGGSVVVSWQLGMGLATGGSDTNFAVRALQKSLGADGLPKLAKSPDTFWRQAFPDESYIAKLATKHPFVCPVLGGNIPGMIRQAKLALGQTLFRAERIAEAANVFQDLINEAEPTVAMLRALGIALCRLERYDEAYPHLRAAYEQEAGNNPLTACYLACAAAKARPNRAEDKPSNVRWAVRLLSGLLYPVDAEPARLVAGVYAEARPSGAPVPVDDQLRLCNTLIALNIADALAAAAIDHLAATAPDAIRPPFAFTYGRAALEHGSQGERDLDLLAKIFENSADAETYYRDRGWDLPKVERLFLERWSDHHRGFPTVFGPDYPARCEQALFNEAKALESTGKVVEAEATIDLLRRLIPPSAASFDQLAKLAWLRGEVDETARLLHEWAAQSPGDPTPQLRLAVLEQERGNGAASAELVRAAHDRSAGEAKTAAAYLAAKLALRRHHTADAVDWLKACLAQDSRHTGALTLLAALQWDAGDRAGLAQLAPAMNQPQVTDPHFRYMTAVTWLVAGDLEGARIAAGLGDRGPDVRHLVGVIESRAGDAGAAAEHFASIINEGEGPLTDHARAMLGRVKIDQGEYAEAVRHWLAVPEAKRKAWGIAEALPGWAYLAGVQSLQAGAELAACEWFDRARELGYKDPRLNALQERAAVAEVRGLVAGGATAALEPFLPVLDRAAKNRGSLQLAAVLLLARILRQRDRLPEARDVLRRVTPPPLPVLMELGLVAFQDQQLSQAEECFARVLQEQPDNAAARHNLFWTRLSLGQPAAAQELLPDLIQAAQTPKEQRLLTQLQIVMKGGGAAGPLLGDMTADEEQRLVAALFAISDLDITVPWLCVLSGARSHSPPAREAQTIGMIRLGKQLFDRGDWLGCEKWLSPLAKARPIATVRNLLGCCLCLQQDFAGGILHLQEALRLAGDDPRMHQNLALAFTWMGELDEADLCWGRYLGTADRRLPRPPGFIEYHDQLRYQVLRHLGNQAYDRERWGQALSYLAEAQQFHPENVELAERLFLLQVQGNNRAGARKTLTQLQSLRPRHAAYELYELDLIEVRNAADLERLLEALSKLVEKLIDDPSVQEKAVGRLFPQLQARADQLTRVLREIREDLHRLPEESTGWYDALRDLRGIKKDLRRLRQIDRYAAALQVSDATRRKLDKLNDDLERKIDYCRRWEDLD
jgi:tetratricopeptide (TPR) repeat protein